MHYFVAPVSKTELWKAVVKEPSCDRTVCPAVAIETRPCHQIIHFPSRLIPPAATTLAGLTQRSRVNATSETRHSRPNTDCRERPLTLPTAATHAKVRRLLCASWPMTESVPRAAGKARGNPVALGCSRQKAHTKSRGTGINPRRTSD